MSNFVGGEFSALAKGLFDRNAGTGRAAAVAVDTVRRLVQSLADTQAGFALPFFGGFFAGFFATSDSIRHFFRDHL